MDGEESYRSLFLCLSVRHRRRARSSFLLSRPLAHSTSGLRPWYATLWCFSIQRINLIAYRSMRRDTLVILCLRSVARDLVCCSRKQKPLLQWSDEVCHKQGDHEHSHKTSAARKGYDGIAKRLKDFGRNRVEDLYWTALGQNDVRLRTSTRLLSPCGPLGTYCWLADDYRFGFPCH